MSKWIPCGERMPEEHEWIGTKRFGTTISDEVYVTFENPEGERFTKHLSFQNGKLSSYNQREIDALYKGSVPIAWMPLPEPYKEDGREMTLYEFLKPFVKTSPVPLIPVELRLNGAKVYEGELKCLPVLYMARGCVVREAKITWGDRKMIIVIDEAPKEDG